MKNFTPRSSAFRLLIISLLSLLFHSENAFAQPANDLCSNATILTVGAGCTNGTNVAATTTAASDGPIGCLASAPSNSVWYQFTTGPIAGSTYKISTDNGGTSDTEMKLFSDCSGTLAPGSNCNEDAGTVNSVAAVITNNSLAPNTTYYIMVDIFGGTTGTFCISVDVSPPNDLCGSAIPLTVNGACINGNNTLATTTAGSDGVTGCWSSAASNTVWYSFTTTATPAAPYIISTDNGGLTNTQIKIFTNCTGTLAPGTNCNDNGGTVNANAAVINTSALAPNTTYFVMVDVAAAATGPFCINVSSSPANDLCGTATPITVGGSCVNGTNFLATTTAASDGAAAGCWTSVPSNTVWYQFTTNSTGGAPYQISTDNGGTTNTQIKIFSDCAGTAAPGTACVEDGGTTNATSATLVTNSLAPNTTYYVMVDVAAAATGNFCINVTTSPLNDPCGGAIPLTVNGSCVSGTTNLSTTTAASDGAIAGCWASVPSNTVWYSFTTGATAGAPYLISTDNGGATNTEIKIFGDCLGTPAPGTNCAENGGTVNANAGVINTSALAPNTTYYVMVDVAAAAVGTFCISAASNPPNDDCSNAIPLTVGAACTNGTNVLATTVASDPVGSCWAPASVSNSVWYSFTATSDKIDVNFSGGTLLANTQAAVYSGTCAGTLTQIACSPAGSTLTLTGLTIGSTYLIEVDGNAANTGTFCISVTVSPPNDGVLGTVYNNSKCGLNYVQASRKISNRHANGGAGSGLPVTFAIAGLPATCFQVEKGYLWFEESYFPGSPLNPTVTVTNPLGANFTYTATIAGSAGEKCWSESGTRTYRVDVSSSITGNGNYVVNIQTNPNPAYTAGYEIDGGTFMVIYSDPFVGYQGSLIINDGIITTQGATVNTSITGFTSCANSTFANAFAVLGDAQYGNGGVETPHQAVLNGGAAASYLDAFWNFDTKVTAVTAGQTTSSFSLIPGYTGTLGLGGLPDCESLILTGLYYRTTSCVSCNIPLTLSAVPTHTTCNLNNGSAVATPSTALYAPYTYSWNSTPVQTTATATGLAPGTYTVTISGAGGCRTATATVTINPSTVTPAPTPGNNGPVCAGSALNLTSNTIAGATYSWTGPGAFTSTLEDPSVSGSATAAMAGTYSVTATVAGCTSPAGTTTVTVTQPSVATFSYTGSPYCQNAANPSPTFSGGGVAGTFTSTAGLSINAGTGVVNLAASTAGTYTVTNTIAASGGCPAVTATATITITPLPVATFSYTGSPYCKNAANPSPTFSGGGVAGTFTSTAGLSINATNGVVNLAASTAGTYTVTNTIAASGGCPAVTATATITITPLPIATFSYTASPYCQNAANPSPTFSGGGTAGTFSSTAGLSINAATGVVNLAASTAGTYTVTNTIAASGGCPAVTATATITITALPVATFSYTGSPYCQNAANPSPTFSGGGTAGTFSSTAGLVFISTSTGQVNLSASTPGTYTVTNTIAPSGGCPATTATASITISPVQTATFSYTASPYCQGGINPSPTFSGGGIAGTFSSTAGLVFVSTSTGQINLSASTAGTYTVTNTIPASGGCPAVTATSSITINASPIATFNYTASPYCQNAANPSPTFTGGGIAGTFSSTAGLVFVSTSTGQINLSASTPGTYTVTNTIPAAGGCPASTATSSISITPAPVATFSYTGSPYCQNAANPSPTFSGGGVAGTFTSTAGLSINAATGVVNLGASTAGTYTVTNTIAASGGCPSTSATANITISPLAVATFSYTASPYCQNAANPSPTFSGGGVAGTFSSTAGLVFVSTSTGQINLSASTAGTYTVTNTIAAAGGCPAVTATSAITINPVQNAAFNYSTGTYCQTGANPTPTITGSPGGTFTSSPAGLVFVSTSTGQINLSASALNTYSITYTTPGPCANSSSVNVTITTAPSATFSYTGSPYCQSGPNPTPTFSGGGTAGTFSSTAGLVFVNTGTGEINLAASTPGTYTVTNTIAAAGGCAAATATANITINSSPSATFSYTASPYCQNAANPSPTFSGGGTAGTFTSTAGLVFVSAATGQINLSASTAGTYTVTNTIAASGACPAITATATITITPLPVATFSYTGSPYCQNTTNPSPTFSGGGIAGTFTSTAGLVINGATGVVNLSASTAGTYTVTNTIPAASGCPAVTATATITITPVPVATFSYTASPYCQNGTNPSPTFSGGGTAGTFSSTAGLVFVSTSTGVVNLSASTPGTYTVTNTIAASGGCAAVSATASITITTPAIATFSYSGSPYCQSGANPSPTFSGGGVAGTFSSTAGLVFVSASTGQINLSASTPGTYTVTNTIAASGGCSTVTATASVTITPPPVATFSYTASPYCQSAANPSPTFSGGGTAGTFTSTAGLVFVSASTGVVNLSSSTPGTYTVTNTLAASGGCPAVTATANITINPAPTANFSYTGSPYCQNAVNPFPTFGPGAIAGTFSSTAGLVFVNASTGEINLSASTAGTYTVTNTIPASGGCPAGSATASITITPVQSAAFNYSSSTFCQTGSNPIPVITGVAGGTFTSSPAGLIFVSSSTGEINLASSALNTYSITYTTAGPCGNSSTATITITNAPVATFAYSGSPYCQNATNPSPTFSGGGTAGTFTSTAGLVINAADGTVNLAASTAGTYTVTNTIAASGGCAAASATASITINPVQNAGFSYSSPTFCQTGANPTPVITGVPGGIFTSAPAGLTFVSTSTGEIDLAGSALNTFTVTYTTPGPCSSTSSTSVTISNPTSATMNYNGPYCQSGSNPFPNYSAGASAGSFTTSPAGLVFVSSSTGEVDLAASTPGTYTITNTIAGSGGCPASVDTAAITITSPPIASFSYTGTPYCQTSANPLPTFTGGGVAGTFTPSSPSLVFVNSSTGEIDLAASTPGTYTVTNTIPASGGCAAITATANITINGLDNASFNYSTSTFCQSGSNPIPTITGIAGGTFTSSPAGLVFVSTGTGEIDLSSSTLNTYTITYTTPGPCVNTSSATVTISNAPAATFSYTGTPYCQNAANPVPTFTGSGTAGTFSSSAGLVFVNTATGEVDLTASAAGTYTVVNTIPASGGCAAASATASITISPLQDASFNYSSTTFCASGSNPTPTITGVSGGLFSSSPVGLNFVSAATGEIDLATTTLNSYTITYTTPGPCANTSSVAITITNAPDASFSYVASPYCQSGVDPGPVFGAGASGGTFTSTAGLSINTSGLVDLSASTPGTYTVTNAIAASGGCAASSATSTITISPSQNAGFNYSGSTFCVSGTNPIPTITGVSGGVFTSSPAGLNFVSSSTGEVNLASTALNTYTITYTTPGPCADSSNVSITITNAPAATFSYTGSPYCIGGTNPIPTFSGGGSAGIFSSTAGLVFANTSTGEIDLAASTAGTYTVTNTIAASGGCAAVSATSTVTINPLQNASFSYSGSTFCASGTNPTPTIAGVAGGTFSSSPAGLVFANTSTGEIDLASSVLNSYTITYTTPGPCVNSSTFNVTITNSPSASFSFAGSPYCQGGTNPSPTFTGGSAGTFTSSAGLSINASTGVIDLSASTPGTYTITNSIAASGGCPASTATASVTITAPQTAAFSYTASPYCQNGTNPTPVIGGGSVAGTFTSTSGLTINASTGVVDLASSTAGTYTVTNTIAASGGCPSTSSTATITISPLQDASFSYSASSYCMSGPNTSPTITGIGGGTFSSSPAGLNINPATGAINVSSSSINTYTVTYTTAGPCANSSSVTVTISAAPVASASASGPVCSGSSVTLSSSGGSSYSWSGPNGYSSTLQNPVIDPATVANSGTYTVTVNTGGCTSTAQASVTVNAMPVADAGADTTIIEGASLVMPGTGGSSFTWSPSEGLSCTNCPSPIATPTVTTTYCTTATTGACSSSDCRTVTVEVPCITNKELGVPNAFSPNNDGNNDMFCLQGWSACMSDFTIMIYDRWGEKMFESSQADFCWDGTFRGRTLDPAVFVYFIKATYTTGDKITKKGNISIIR